MANNSLLEKEVVVTGMGLVSPLEDTLESVWQALLAGKTAVRRWPDLAEEGFRIPLAARLENMAGDDATRGSRMAITAARRAVGPAIFAPGQVVGVFTGSTMGESAAFELSAAGKDIDLSAATLRAFPQAVQADLGYRGPIRGYGAACAAGNYAIGGAAETVAMGLANAALAGGVEPFSRIALAGFSRSRAMAGDLCRPFDKRRGGMQLGEGAAFLLLENRGDALRQGRKALARILSLGLSCDAYHPTAPSPDGEGMARAMRNSLRQAGLLPGDIDWICAHGSGTRISDAAEAQAIVSVFGNSAPPVSGFKGAFGHTLGAATAIEAVIAVLAMQKGILPPTVHLENPDPEFDLDLVTVPRENGKLEYVLNCGYGFGGLNSALVLQKI